MISLFTFLIFLGVSANTALRGERLFDDATPTPTQFNFGAAVLGDNKDIPIISQATVIMVLYGNGPYMSQITGPAMGTFYTQFMQSPQFTWIKQYKTRGAPNGKSNQIINAQGGLFQKKYQLISPVPNPLTKGAFETKFLQFLQSGKLPAPMLDAQKFVNSLYIFHFPAGQIITYLDPEQNKIKTSCQDWCGYHDFMQYTFNGLNVKVPYVFLPDVSADSLCFFRCGSHNNSFLITQSIVTHEIIEAVTNPWQMSGCGEVCGNFSGNEISDRCEGVDEAWQSGNTQYVVQRSWSNTQSQCIGNVNSSFSIAYSNGTLFKLFDLGEPQSYVIFSTNYTNPPKQISFSCWPPGLPQGWTCTFDPPVVNAGQATTVTVHSTTPVDYLPQITVIGTQSPEQNTNARIKLTLPVQNLVNGLFTNGLANWIPDKSGGNGMFNVTNGVANQFHAAVVTTLGGTVNLHQQFLVNAQELNVYAYAVCKYGGEGGVDILLKRGSSIVYQSPTYDCDSDIRGDNGPFYTQIPSENFIGQTVTLILQVWGLQTTTGVFFNITQDYTHF